MEVSAFASVDNNRHLYAGNSRAYGTNCLRPPRLWEEAERGASVLKSLRERPRWEGGALQVGFVGGPDRDRNDDPFHCRFVG
jgi:hypothetical protein